MAASGKKKGKKKGKTLNLNEFLSAGESAPAPGTSFVYSQKSSWAEEAPEAEGDSFSSSTPWADSKSSSGPIALPTAPKSAQAIELDMSKLPDNPPYTIYLGNLPFDCSTEDIKKFLSQSACNVSDVRLPIEGDSQRPKGFGYAEIDDIDSLYKALSLDNSQLRNRRIRVDLASQAQTDGKGFGGFDKTASDWRRSDGSSNRGEWNQGGDRGNKYGESRPSQSDSDDRWRDRSGGGGVGADNPDSYGGGRGGGYGSRDRGGGGGFERNYDRGGSGGGGGFERNYDRGGGGGFDRGGGSDSRGFGREWDRDRSGGGGTWSRGGNQDYERGGERGFDRADDRGGFERRNDRGSERGYDRGYNRAPERGGYDRGPDRSYDRAPERSYNRGGDEGRDEWRRGEEGGPRREESEYNRPPPDRGQENAPRERKKLVLQKRTAPIKKETPQAASASSIFGGAKPVDTAAKEREIEMRLERERRDAEQQRQSLVVEKEPPARKDSSGQEHAARVRRDSERSEGREGRTRHSSTGSGRGGPRPVIMRRESEKSNEEEVFHKDDQAPTSPTPTSPPPPKTPTSPRQLEDAKLIPAPPPKENAWARRSETVASPPSGPPGRGGQPQDRHHTEPGPRGGPAGGTGRGGGGGGGQAWSRGQGQRSDGGGRGGGVARGPPRDERPRPQQHKDPLMPKFEDPKPKDWSDANKFSSLLEDEVAGSD